MDDPVDGGPGDAIVSGDLAEAQRAWVVLRGIGPAPHLCRPWNLNGVFTNTGKTPAKNAGWSCVNEFAKNESDFKWWRIPYMNQTLVAPNDQDMSILHLLMAPKITQPLLDTIKTAEVHLFVYGSAVYLDVFGEWHWLTFYQEPEPDGQAWDSCTNGNDTGDVRYPPPPLGGVPKAPNNLSIPFNPTN